MRIGMVCPYSFDAPGGVQAHILDLAAVFTARGHSVGVLGPADANVDLPDYVTRGGASLPVPFNGSIARIAAGPHVTRYTREFIMSGDFDVLHVHEPNATSFSLAALRCAQGPIVATYHTSATASVVLQLALPALRGNLEKIQAGIAVSELARRWQVEQVGTDPIVIPNGIDTARFTAARGPRNYSTEVEIVFLGRRDEPRKGLGVLLEAVDKLSRPARVTVVGGGRARSAPGVRFAGQVSETEKARILGRADIYVAPNLGGESFGIVLVEAMAAGCAVVASNIEAFAAVCDSESETPAGVLFEVGDSDALAASLQMLIDDPAKRNALIDAGTARAREFDWSRVADQVMAVYEAVATGEKVGLGR
ncbi:glycosyltransferase family 4 protein [Corynebacterium glaucum]|uniref:glycosyltransferase family 4 protein n=1 Tax=Corynebacterium glaucum TaxID=187491 RepID=UPI0025B609EE|nr:glycosyltransferase family 4 protein [Corynebacterium glaucum]WJZ07874.1 GDP-mannose-dependent alpha-(1-2)-phosphatidylinositol mannosyltransferase [Corynebacterium glaucum]